MPSAPKPKKFVAATNFLYAGRSYKRGQEITDRNAIAHLTKWGTRFAASPRPAPAETPANPDRDAAATPPAESPKE